MRGQGGDLKGGDESQLNCTFQTVPVRLGTLQFYRSDEGRRKCSLQQCNKQPESVGAASTLDHGWNGGYEHL